MSDKIQLSPLVRTGFPWRALAVALAVLVGGFASGFGLGYPMAGVAVVSIFAALILFSALLGWGTQ